MVRTRALRRSCVALVVALVAWVPAGCGGDEVAEGTAVTVGALLDDPVYGELVAVEGTVGLLGELFCPCFELSSGGGTVMVWYDLMVDGEEYRPPVDVSDVANGDTVVVEGELRRLASAADLTPEMWAASIEVAASGAGLADPASVYCEEQGGTVDIRDTDAGQVGSCVFDDGSECEEWAFYRGECEPGA